MTEPPTEPLGEPLLTITVYDDDLYLLETHCSATRTLELLQRAALDLADNIDGLRRETTECGYEDML